MITYHLKATLVKDMVLLERFTTFLSTYKHPALNAAIVAAMPDIVALGVYMDFLEQEYGIGVSADNANYNLYFIPVDEHSRHFDQFKQSMIKRNTHIIDTSNSNTCTTVMENYIEGVIEALMRIILPF